ncbi:E3 ubiquitin-protein ligase TRIM7 [Larimichthys crocea]|uniref:E3 ubiquitin-protein ligase TRIM7 n=1 Tax=Larimichthys crocea TaxID=215358 RepID=A0A6G0IIS3_LARCR|nr:E3 ubiquitin-protein ligase TRIM7 [Larimichthys crocea]
MAGDSRFIWFPILLSCVFQVSDHRHVPGDAKIVVLKNPGVDNIFSKIPIILPDGIDPKNINVTSITLKTCTGVEERLTLLNSQLQQKTVRNRQLDNEAFGLRREVRMLKLQLAACSATASAVAGSYQTQLQSKMEQLLQRLDGDTFLILKTIALTRDVNSLQKKITLASNSIERTTEIRVLQGKLQEKTSELNVTMQRIVRNTNGLLILQIISLQNQIWDLEQAKSSRGEASFQPDRIILGLQENLNRKLTQLQSTGDASSIMLELISVHSKIAETERLIGVLIEQSKTKSIDYQRQWMQKVNLLRKKVLQLNHDENNIDLTKEIFQLQTEMDNFRQLMLNAKNTTDTILEEQRVNLEVWKKQQENLQEQLQKADYAQAQRIMNIITIMKEVRGLKVDEQDQTTSTKSKCSGIELMYAGVKTEFEQNIAELKRAGDSKAALILNMINLHNELKTLKKQISTTDDPETISVLQRQLEKMQNDLNSKTADIKRLIANPQSILTIIELHNEIWDLQKKAANDTTRGHIKELQNRVNALITEIGGKGDENTKLILKIITLQSQVEQLQGQLSDLQMLQTSEARQLKNDLTTTKEELQKNINKLNENNQTNSRLILTVTNLQNQLRILENERRIDDRTSSLTITQLRTQLKEKMEKHSHDQAVIKELQRKLQSKNGECSGLEENQYQYLKTEFEEKIAELKRAGDSKAALILKVINLHDELKTLKKLISTTNDLETISALQRQLEKKQEDLNSNTADIERLIANPQTILKIITLQSQVEHLLKQLSEHQEGQNTQTTQLKNDLSTKNEELQKMINDLNEKHQKNAALKLREQLKKKEEEHTHDQTEIKELQNDLDAKMKELESKSDTVTSLVLENELDDIRNQIKEKTILIGSSDTRISDLTAQILELQRKIKPLEDEILTLKEENAEKTKDFQSQREQSQQNIKQLQQQNNNLQNENSKLKTEFEQKIAELNRTGDKAALVLNMINLHDELKTLKEQISTTDDTDKISALQKQLEKKQEDLNSNTADIERLIANPQTIITIIEVQNEIWDLEKKPANETNSERLKELQDRVDGLITEIDDNESTKLLLKIITLQSQVEHLLKQLSEHQEGQNTQTTQLKNDLSTKNEELQKIINDLNEKHQKNAALILTVTDLQKQLKNLEEEKFSAGQKDSATITKLREQLKKKEEEHTHDQTEIKELQNDLDAKMKELESKSDTVTSLVLENELDDIRNQIKEKTILIGSSDTRISDLTAQILELQRKIKPLEDEILTLKEENAKKTKELQERLDLSKKQLQDSELLLKEADTKNFNMIMEIADLRTKLKKAQREASKAAKKNIDELEQQIQTQQAEIEQLEKTNKDLKQEVEELKTCRNDVNAQCTDIQTKLEQSQEDANRIEQQLHEKENILQEQLQQLQDLALEHNNLQNEYSNLENKQHQTQKFADDLKQQLVDKDGNLNQLEQELEEQRRENKRLEDENNRLQNKLNFVEDKTIHPERITLDPNTANPRIVLSADNTEIITTANIQNIPDHPDQFDVVLGVMGKTGWSTGRHYWEVSVDVKPDYLENLVYEIQ